MTSKQNYIDELKSCWGPEFASILEIEYRHEYDEIAAMGCFTIAYHIADNFEDGKYRSEILKMLGIEK